MGQPDTTALDIYQRLLDEIGATITTRDVAAYVNHFGYPHHMQTFDTELEIKDAETMGRFFDRLVARIAEVDGGVLHRVCTVADYVDAQTIRGCHVSRLINRALVVVEDYYALSTLRLVGGVWKVVASQYAEAEPSLPTRISAKEQ